MAQSPAAAAQAMINNLQANTGKTLPQWFAVLKKTNFAKHGEYIKFLTGEHDVTHGYANLIAHCYRDSRSGAETEDPVAAQYGGAKQQLRPLYDKLVGIVQGFGSDVDIAPKKAYVSLRRKKQFALIQPSTKDRLDLGLNLKGSKPAGRLEASGSFNAMVSHRVRLGSLKDINSELKAWLKQAYDLAG
jgi:hypothetical protein